jgi:hypothetical protein
VNVYDEVDISVRYLHGFMKVDVVVKKSKMKQIKESLAKGSLDPGDFLTARFEIPSVLLTSQAMKGGKEIDLYSESDSLDPTLLCFKKNETIVHTISPVEAYLIDENGKRMFFIDNNPDPDNMIYIETAQRWQLNRNKNGIAELSAKLADLAHLPDGDLVIDPLLDINNASKDSYIHAYMPTTNYGSSSILQVATSSPADFLIAFNGVIASIGQYATINSAKIELHTDSAPSSSFDIRAYKITRDWSESTVTWNSHNGCYSSGSYGNATTLNTSQTDYDIDVTVPLRSHYADSTSSTDMIGYCGFYIKGISGYNLCNFNSSESVSNLPKLVVDYSPLPDLQSVSIVQTGYSTYLHNQKVKFTCNVVPENEHWTYLWEVTSPPSSCNPNSSTSRDFITQISVDSDIEVKVTVTHPVNSTSVSDEKFYYVETLSFLGAYNNTVAVRDWTGGSTLPTTFAFPLNAQGGYAFSMYLNWDLSNETHVQVRGVGNPFSYDPITISMHTFGNYSGTLYPTTNFTSSLNKLNHSVTWQYRIQNSYNSYYGSWMNLSNQEDYTFYTIYSNPGFSPYNFALDKVVGYANGQTSVSGIASSICTGIDGDFDYDPAEDSIGTDNILNLYFEDDDDFDGEPEAVCYDNAYLLYYLLESIGINNSLYRELWGGCMSTVVCYYSANPALSIQFDVMAKDHAQYQPHFSDHAIVKLNGIYYDPSYGSTYSSFNAIDQIIIQMAPANNNIPGHVGPGILQEGDLTPSNYHLVQ